MNNPIVFWSLLALLGLISSGCSSSSCGRSCRSIKVSSGFNSMDAAKKEGVKEAEHFLSNERITDAVKRQERQFENGEARLAHLRELKALQQQAEILLEVSPPKNIRLLASKIRKRLPRVEFPIAQIPNYFPKMSDGQRAKLVVVMMSDIWLGSWPDERELMRLIDKCLRSEGVKRRVYMVLDNFHYYDVDSATD